MEWWSIQWKSYLTVNRWKLDVIGIKQAEKNYDYWITMMERVGNLTPESPRLPGGTTVVSRVVAEQWKKYGG